MRCTRRFPDGSRIISPCRSRTCYQSLHTTLIGPRPASLSRSRSVPMRCTSTAEYGIAAHWKYKEGWYGKEPAVNQEEEKLSWLRQILEWQTGHVGQPVSSFHLLKKRSGFVLRRTYTASRLAGDVKNLPKGSTPIDFAYSIHSAVGNQHGGCAGRTASWLPIDYQIQNGDRIEVITSQNSKGPSRDWLKHGEEYTGAGIRSTSGSASRTRKIISSRDASFWTSYCKAKGLNLSELPQAGVSGEGCAQVRLPRLGFCCGCDWSRRYEGRPGSQQAPRREEEGGAPQDHRRGGSAGSL